MIENRNLGEETRQAVREVVSGWSHEQAIRIAQCRQGHQQGHLQAVFREWRESGDLRGAARESLNEWLLSSDVEDC